MDKKEFLNTHFRQRCIERIGFSLDENKIIDLIQNNRLELHSKPSKRISRWYYHAYGKKIVVVYDCRRHCLATAWVVSHTADYMKCESCGRIIRGAFIETFGGSIVCGRCLPSEIKKYVNLNREESLICFRFNYPKLFNKYFMLNEYNETVLKKLPHRRRNNV